MTLEWKSFSNMQSILSDGKFLLPNPGCKRSMPGKIHGILLEELLSPKFPFINSYKYKSKI